MPLSEQRCSHKFRQKTLWDCRWTKRNMLHKICNKLKKIKIKLNNKCRISAQRKFFFFFFKSASHQKWFVYLLRFYVVRKKTTLVYVNNCQGKKRSDSQFLKCCLQHAISMICTSLELVMYESLEK